MTLTVLAWLGTISYLLAYYLVSTDRVVSTGVPYQAMNIFAAVVLTAYGIQQDTWPSVALNAAWFGIGVLALTRRRNRRRPDASALESRPAPG